MSKFIAIAFAVTAATPAFATAIRAPAPEAGSGVVGLAVIAVCGLGWLAFRATAARKAAKSV